MERGCSSHRAELQRTHASRLVTVVSNIQLSSFNPSVYTEQVGDTDQTRPAILNFAQLIRTPVYSALIATLTFVYVSSRECASFQPGKNKTQHPIKSSHSGYVRSGGKPRLTAPRPK